MADSSHDKTKILRGAFVKHGLSHPARGRVSETEIGSGSIDIFCLTRV